MVDVVECGLTDSACRRAPDKGEGEAAPQRANDKGSPTVEVQKGPARVHIKDKSCDPFDYPLFRPGSVRSVLGKRSHDGGRDPN
jgi:hypothetical protein